MIMVVKKALHVAIKHFDREMAKEQTASDVDHPKHYGGEDNPFETIKVVEALGFNFNLGNAYKYISRAGKKGNAVEDLNKAIWYLEREVTNLENK